MFTMKKLSLVVTSREGKKEELSKAQVDEVLAIVSEIVAESPSAILCLIQNGLRRLGAKWAKKKRAAN